jgi:hypothetical protein
VTWGPVLPTCKLKGTGEIEVSCERTRPGHGESREVAVPRACIVPVIECVNLEASSKLFLMRNTPNVRSRVKLTSCSDVHNI